MNRTVMVKGSTCNPSVKLCTVNYVIGNVTVKVIGNYVIMTVGKSLSFKGVIFVFHIKFNVLSVNIMDHRDLMTLPFKY